MAGKTEASMTDGSPSSDDQARHGMLADRRPLTPGRRVFPRATMPRITVQPDVPPGVDVQRSRKSLDAFGEVQRDVYAKLDAHKGIGRLHIVAAVPLTAAGPRTVPLVESEGGLDVGDCPPTAGALPCALAGPPR
jgi:hypothetical protein